MVTPPASAAPLIAMGKITAMLNETKAAMRAAAMARRAACDPAWGAQLTTHVMVAGLIPAGAVVAGFWPLPGEIDIRPLLNALAAAGHRLALPETPKRGLPLLFRAWAPGAPLVAGKFGTSHPQGEIITPDIVLVPLLAFDDQGHRLGYGAGYYDRSLAALPQAYRLGCAFAAQEFDDVPVGPDDQTLHAVASETGIDIFKV